MTDVKFSCPHCTQHIQAGTDYGGMQITCPTCSGSLVVPAAAPVAPLVQASLAPPAASPRAPQQMTFLCPSCGAPVKQGISLCRQCGANVATSKPSLLVRPSAAPWYKTALPYVGATLLMLGILYLLGRHNPALKIAFVGVAILFAFVVHIIATAAAFRKDVGTGLLTLCIWIYAVYFVFKMQANKNLKILYASAVLINLSVGLVGFF